MQLATSSCLSWGPGPCTHLSQHSVPLFRPAPRLSGVTCQAKRSSQEAPARSTPASAEAEQSEDAPAEDTRTYPGKDAGGFTGGWAGGEVGLRKFIQETEGRPSNGASSSSDAQPQTQQQSGGEPGKKGGPSSQDAAKYPGKEAVGPLSGITGGFAGGERGLQQYIEKGDLTISPERQGQFSPLLVAGFVGTIVTLVAVLASQGEDAAEVQIDTKVLGLNLSSLRIDQYSPVQRLVLTVAFGLLGLSLTVGGARFVAQRLRRGAVGARVAGARTLTFAGFLAVVLLLAKVILDTK